MPTSGGIREAEVVIEGTALTFAESIALRCAVFSMRMSVNDPATRRRIGKELADGYDFHLQKAELLLVNGANKR